MENQIFNANEIPWETLNSGKTKILVGRETSKTGVFRLFNLAGGEKFESHEHDFFQCMYIIKGKGEAFVDDTVEEVGPGMTIVVLPNQCHGLKNLGDTDMDVIVFETYDISPQNTPFVDF